MAVAIIGRDAAEEERQGDDELLHGCVGLPARRPRGTEAVLQIYIVFATLGGRAFARGVPRCRDSDPLTS